MTLKVALLFLLLLQTLSELMCPATNCNFSGLSWTGQVCGQLSADGSSYSFNLSSCAKDLEYCAFTTFSTDSLCMPKNVVPIYDAYPGEKCTDAHLCNSGTCINGTCEPFPQCQNYYDCGSRQYCDTGSCKSLKPEGSTCYFDYECAQNTGCDNLWEAYPGTCRKFLSLPPGTVVKACNAFGNGFGVTGFGRSPLCTSSYCYNFNGGFRCTESFKSLSKTYPQACEMGSECVSEVDGVSGMAYSAPCQCGFNSNGQGYCPQLAGDPLMQDTLSLWQDWLDSDEINNCNTYSRLEVDQFSCCLESSGYHGVKKLWYKIHWLNAYPLVVAADKCYLQFVAYSYYLAEEAYDSAGLLVASMVLIVS